MPEPTCLNCGLPLTRNPHPKAGKPSHLNIVGATWGCLPCAEIRANGMRRVLSALRDEMHKRIKSKSPMTCEAMLGLIEILDEDRRLASVRRYSEARVGQNSDHTQSITTDHNESENLGNRGFLHDSQGIQIPPVPPVGLEPIAVNGDCESACRDGLSAGDQKTDQIGGQS